MELNTEDIFLSLRNTMDLYYKISDETWEEFKEICSIRTLNKNEYAFDVYSKVNEISYVYQGLFRLFTTNEKGEEFTKNFFWEGRLFAPTVALLRGSEIKSSIQAIENSVVVDINFTKYRELLYKFEDLKLYHIFYIEKHWMIEKDDNHSALVLEDALIRYQRFLSEYENIVPRLSQYHIASYLGISPTHLSRVRKELKKDD